MPLPAGVPRVPASDGCAILGDVTYEPDLRGGNRVPVLRDDWREPLRAQRDPLAWGSGRPRSNRDTSRWRKQSWLGRFVSTYGWRAYALPALRHRLLLNFEGEAEQINADAIVSEMLTAVATE